jgi:hypothetical protein
MESSKLERVVVPRTASFCSVAARCVGRVWSWSLELEFGWDRRYWVETGHPANSAALATQHITWPAVPKLGLDAGLAWNGVRAPGAVPRCPVGSGSSVELREVGKFQLMGAVLPMRQLLHDSRRWRNLEPCFPSGGSVFGI